jgi:tRNA pseudouridine32 synthase/23S rRNA pseudouridine746 synthase
MLNYQKDSCFHKFKEEVDVSSLPLTFTFPFAYTPHPLTIQASQIVINKLISPIMETGYKFGLEGNPGEMGKMFGVLIVKNTTHEVGFLAAFSGKILNSNRIEGFCPPVFDILDEKGFYKQGEAAINKINLQIIQLESSEQLKELEQEIQRITSNLDNELNIILGQNEVNKAKRKKLRSLIDSIPLSTEHKLIMDKLDQESKDDNLKFKRFKKYKQSILSSLTEELSQRFNEIDLLKKKRKELSAKLQRGIFSNFTFLNILGESKSLEDIFSMDLGYAPPSGSGECAGPKLLQYAFQRSYKPIVMAEFWWGAAPSSEIRKHNYFYPACRSKCEPILAHMLRGMQLDQHPMFAKPYGIDINLDVLYEDDDVLAICKPEGFLSVPGKQIIDSVQLRLQRKYGEQQALLVHRLDMSTSGILLIARNKLAHENLQSQFLARTIKKKYIALLDGHLDQSQGVIELPLRVDLDNRPRQLVCYEFGKMAITQFETLRLEGDSTRIAFYPITGRTHQLRVHSAHQLGLNMPILGDDLYGQRGDRLHLHASSITFQHPTTNKSITIESAPPF